MTYSKWKKIDDVEDLMKMKPPCSLIRYSGQGVPRDSFLSTDEEYKAYLIEAIIGEEISFQESGSPTSMPSSIGLVRYGSLHKTIDDLIQEGQWYYVPKITK
jgi:hypothetical protein